MHDETAFLRAIRVSPDTDTPFLIYADWLEEQGQRPKAEYLRLECELARLANEQKRSGSLETRLQSLAKQVPLYWPESVSRKFVILLEGNLPGRRSKAFAFLREIVQGSMHRINATIDSTPAVLWKGYVQTEAQAIQDRARRDYRLSLFIRPECTLSYALYLACPGGEARHYSSQTLLPWCKAVKEATGLSLPQTRALVRSAPCALLCDVSLPEAARAKIFYDERSLDRRDLKLRLDIWSSSAEEQQYVVPGLYSLTLMKYPAKQRSKVSAYLKKFLGYDGPLHHPMPLEIKSGVWHAEAAQIMARAQELGLQVEWRMEEVK
jgi:uncharacterized protein (TIGR02996 family)